MGAGGRQFDEFVPVGDIVSCLSDTLWCPRWWQDCRTGDVFFLWWSYGIYCSCIGSKQTHLTNAKYLRLCRSDIQKTVLGAPYSKYFKLWWQGSIWLKFLLSFGYLSQITTYHIELHAINFTGDFLIRSAKAALTPNVRGPSFLGLTRTISWLLMPWLFMSPGHQQPWYWLYRMCRSFSYLREDFEYLCHINVDKWHKM